MKLDELEITRKLQRSGQPGSDLENILVRAGWTPLGHGAEAGVAMHPLKKYVLKIFPKTSKYMEFLDLVRQAPNNPHFPKFSRIAKPIPGTNLMYVRMEHLEKIRDFDIVTRFPQLLCLLEKLYVNHHVRPPARVRANVSWNPGQSGLLDCNDLDITPDEKTAFDLLSDKIQQIGWRRADLHAANFMARGNTWVITDPFI